MFNCFELYSTYENSIVMLLYTKNDNNYFYKQKHHSLDNISLTEI